MAIADPSRSPSGEAQSAGHSTGSGGSAPPLDEDVVSGGVPVLLSVDDGPLLVPSGSPPDVPSSGPVEAVEPIPGIGPTEPPVLPPVDASGVPPGSQASTTTAGTSIHVTRMPRVRGSDDFRDERMRRTAPSRMGTRRSSPWSDFEDGGLGVEPDAWEMNGQPGYGDMRGHNYNMTPLDQVVVGDLRTYLPRLEA